MLTCCLLVPSSGLNQVNHPYKMYVHDKDFQLDKILRISGRDFPQDCTSVYSVLINNSILGPELRFKEGDKIWIRVYNDLTDANTTIHWHGLTQRVSPFSDGAPMASQWPIPALHYFDYEFELQIGDAGTYWYHTHVDFQALTAFGIFIVEEAEASQRSFEYDEDRVIIFSDVFHTNGSYIMERLQNIPFRWSGDPDNIALNGKSRPPLGVSAAERSSSCEVSVITLDPDRTYRFRFLAATDISEVFVAFEDHRDMTIIEVDGQYVSPVKTGHIEIHVAQRYSVLIRSKSKEELGEDWNTRGKTQYWIQYEMRGTIPFDNPPKSSWLPLYAVLTYNFPYFKADNFNLPLQEVLTLPNETFVPGWLEDQLFSLNQFDSTGKGVPKAEEVTRRVIVDITKNFTTNNFIGHILLQVDGYPWYVSIAPQPYLVSLYKNDTKYFPNYERALANQGYDPVTHTFPGKIGEVLEIVWQLYGGTLDGSTDSHPMHAHGEHYYDIGCGNGIYDPQFAEDLLKARGYKALKRDTSILYRQFATATQPAQTKPGEAAGWRAWRIRVQDPGVWMLHCHKQNHMMLGMQSVWVLGEVKDLAPLTKEQAEGYLTFGGTAYGNSTYAPHVVHFFHD